MKPGKKNCSLPQARAMTSSVSHPSLGQMLRAPSTSLISFSIATILPFSSTKIAASCKMSISVRLLLWMNVPRYTAGLDMVELIGDFVHLISVSTLLIFKMKGNTDSLYTDQARSSHPTPTLVVVLGRANSAPTTTGQRLAAGGGLRILDFCRQVSGTSSQNHKTFVGHTAGHPCQL
jgi:hypothetical protein